MSRKILLQKATRIEGNADIHIEVEDGRIKAARFMVQDFRGFEKFTQGMNAKSVPHTVSRICGLCCTAHQVAGFKALESAMGIAVPDTVKRLRAIALLGETIASHALSYFLLALPDQLGSSDGIFDLMKKHPDAAKEAFWLRKAGNQVLELICKRAVHPTSIGLGEFTVPVNQEDLDEVRDIATNIKGKAAAQIEAIGKDIERTAKISFADKRMTTFLTWDESNGTPAFRVFNRNGKPAGEFSEEDFEDNISEMRVDWSFAKLPYLSSMGFPQGIVLVGPMSRLFGSGSVLDDPDLRGTALASQLSNPEKLYLDDFDSCRLLEIYTCAKSILSHLDNIELPVSPARRADLKISGKGIGVVEAPRGILVHSYLLNQGRMEKMRLYVATQFNNAYINLILKAIAEEHVEKDNITTRGQAMLSKCVRLLDPCLTCATH
jgi:NAD-reducing hydrogenase large subunit